MATIIDTTYCMRCQQAMPAIGGRRCVAVDGREECFPERAPKIYRGPIFRNGRLYR